MTGATERLESVLRDSLAQFGASGGSKMQVCLVEPVLDHEVRQSGESGGVPEHAESWNKVDLDELVPPHSLESTSGPWDDSRSQLPGCGLPGIALHQPKRNQLGPHSVQLDRNRCGLPRRWSGGTPNGGGTRDGMTQSRQLATHRLFGGDQLHHAESPSLLQFARKVLHGGCQVECRRLPMSDATRPRDVGQNLASEESTEPLSCFLVGLEKCEMEAGLEEHLHPPAERGPRAGTKACIVQEGCRQKCVVCSFFQFIAPLVLQHGDEPLAFIGVAKSFSQLSRDPRASTSDFQDREVLSFEFHYLGRDTLPPVFTNVHCRAPLLLTGCPEVPAPDTHPGRILADQHSNYLLQESNASTILRFPPTNSPWPGHGRPTWGALAGRCREGSGNLTRHLVGPRGWQASSQRHNRSQTREVARVDQRSGVRRSGDFHRGVAATLAGLGGGQNADVTDSSSGGCRSTGGGNESPSYVRVGRRHHLEVPQHTSRTPTAEFCNRNLVANATGEHPHRNRFLAQFSGVQPVPELSQCQSWPRRRPFRDTLIPVDYVVFHPNTPMWLAGPGGGASSPGATPLPWGLARGSTHSADPQVPTGLRHKDIPVSGGLYAWVLCRNCLALPGTRSAGAVVTGDSESHRRPSRGEAEEWPWTDCSDGEPTVTLESGRGHRRRRHPDETAVPQWRSEACEGQLSCCVFQQNPVGDRPSRIHGGLAPRLVRYGVALHPFNRSIPRWLNG